MMLLRGWVRLGIQWFYHSKGQEVCPSLHPLQTALFQLSEWQFRALGNFLCHFWQMEGAAGKELSPMKDYSYRKEGEQGGVAEGWRERRGRGGSVRERHVYEGDIDIAQGNSLENGERGILEREEWGEREIKKEDTEVERVPRRGT
ncbi:hypothetical protein JZ751_026268 [Albula glossodonta]|uniref:Uncharacterized protein n=1 Tax=Albula glossodonta TaxID=121402 RepID=A0A8T2PBK6_9TELE|nr:hypothetical protein JZ751_026268 [Albula glossodonta]